MDLKIPGPNWKLEKRLMWSVKGERHLRNQSVQEFSELTAGQSAGQFGNKQTREWAQHAEI